MKKKVHIVSYTHWDREFRWEFEHTRMKFVECIDHLLEIMRENENYKSFLMDGQVGLLDDYLEIRPEAEEEVRDLIAKGKLEIGPWYSLPDCATLNGECVIRNLQYGVQVSKDYGSVLNCGYNVFSFGQIAQLPQIYKHFGIDIIIFYKYMNPVRSKLPEFIWEAPDGTKVFASRLGREARWNFFFAGHIPIVYDRDPWDKGWKYDYGTLGKVMHTADPEGYPFFHEILDPETSYHSKNIEMGFKRTLESVEGTAAPETLLFFDGTDFTEPHPLIPDIIKEMQDKFGDEYEINHSTLGAYLSELKESLGKQKDKLQLVKGPMRDGPVGAVHSDVVTIHPEIKLENAKTESRLIRYAEPLAAMAWASGIDRYPMTYFKKAWKLLFQSHAHDSVHGLGPCELSEGVVSRIKQAGLIAKASERKALNNITKEINTKSIDDASTFLSVNNTAAFARSEVVEAYVDIPADVVLTDVILEDMNGKTCEVQEISREETRGGIYHPRSRNMPYYCTRVRIAFWADSIPALGYKTYKIKWSAKKDYPYPHEDWDAPRIIKNDMLVGMNVARNEHVSLKINADGTFNVTDLKSGNAYDNLNYFLDAGDDGNMWMAHSPDRDAIINSLGKEAEVACVTHGPLTCTFEIRKIMKVPARFDFGIKERSGEKVDLTVTTFVTLKKGSRFVEIKAVVDNTARDHYFKVCFPTGNSAKTTSADGSFSVTDYSTTPDLSCELARHPFQLWCDVQDKGRGLALFSRSTKDYEIIGEEGQNTIAMGLVRSVRVRIPCDNRLWMEYPGDESAQSIGQYTHEYAVLAHGDAWEKDGVYRDSLAFNHPLKACQFGRQSGKLATETSFIEISDPNVVLSSVTKADTRDSVMVRFFNPTASDIKTTLTAGFDFKSACVSKLSEEKESDLAAKGKSVEVTVGKGQIMTVEFAL
ncbi:MAG: hypothetical protein JXR97_00130 [Planctomycetes bacterium]|nr:hypothetical protein [Planctomycetota bacterium]